MAKLIGLSESAVRRMADAVRWVERQQARGFGGQPGGRIDTDGSVPVAMGSETGPFGGLAWLTARTDEAYDVTSPDYPGISRVGVLAGPVGANERGRAWVAGVHPVLVEDVGLIVGDRVGATKDSFVASACLLGPLQIVGLPSAAETARWDAAPGGATYVYARIGHERGNTLFVRGCDSGSETTPLTLRFGSGWTVSQPQAGVIQVDLA